MRLFLDIETLPAAPELRDVWLSTLKEPPEDPEDERDLLARTSLSGDFGRILCIGYWKEPGMAAPDVLTGDEPSILRAFWKLTDDGTLYVGHNLFDFDLPFIVKRSIVHGVPRRHIPMARYRREPVFDTMREWNSWGRERTSLDALAKILGLRTSKESMDGSQVAEAHAAGRDGEIYAYCKEDVRLTRDVYLRITSQA